MGYLLAKAIFVAMDYAIEHGDYGSKSKVFSKEVFEQYKSVKNNSAKGDEYLSKFAQ